MCDVHTYNNEDEILQDLLETNIRQRGNVGGSAKKVGKRIKELERIYGIKNGNNQHSSLPNNSEPSQSDLAMRMGMSVDTLRNYKMLADMIPELSDLVDTGIVTKTTTLAIMKELSEEDVNEIIGIYYADLYFGSITNEISDWEKCIKFAGIEDMKLSELV